LHILAGVWYVVEWGYLMLTIARSARSRRRIVMGARKLWIWAVRRQTSFMNARNMVSRKDGHFSCFRSLSILLSCIVILTSMTTLFLYWLRLLIWCRNYLSLLMFRFDLWFCLMLRWVCGMDGTVNSEN
jgi:hypothetical protein